MPYPDTRRQPCDASPPFEQVGITLREDLANGGFLPYAVRSKLPVEPLYDIKVSGSFEHFRARAARTRSCHARNGCGTAWNAVRGTGGRCAFRTDMSARRLRKVQTPQ